MKVFRYKLLPKLCGLTLLAIGFSITTGIKQSHAQAPQITRTPTSQNSQTGFGFFGIISPNSNPQLFSASLLLVIVLILGFVFIGITIRKGIEALGRNPLNSKAIQRSMFVSILIILLITTMGLIISYQIYRTSPVTEQLIELIPTPILRPKIETTGTVHTTNCFTVSTPFKSSYPKLIQEEKSCGLTFNFDDPLRGQFTLKHEPIPEHGIDENPSVTMRRRYSDKYQPIYATHSAFPNIIGFQSIDEISLFLQSTEKHQFELSFHTLSPDFEQHITTPILYSILDSIAIPSTPSDYTFSPQDATQSSIAQ